MAIDDQILDILRAEYYENGATQQEIAAKFNTSQGQIQSLLSGKRQVAGLTLGTIMKMFPKATLVINGDAAAVHASGTKGNVVGVNNGTIGADCISAAIDKILDSDELSDAEKIKVMKVLKK